ncbi:MAG: adenylate kinase [Bifidobacteriaceae bacterium]|jgi:adenylate kinase|nr:adenylate kinase [Bifidobacteriaceae bacterium]
MTKRVVLLGPPGSGKGTQAVGLAKALGVPAISTGAIFRDNLSRGTKLGKTAGSYMAAGQLVPDEVTNAMVADRLAQPDAADGFILDGYPRNLEQVVELDAMLAERGLEIDLALDLALDHVLVVARLLNRAQIEGRADDTEPVIRERLAVYRRSTEPISGAYAARGKLVSVDGDGTIEDVALRLHAACVPAT